MWGHRKTPEEKAQELQELRKHRIKVEGNARLDRQIQHEKDLISKARGQSAGTGFVGALKSAGKFLNEKQAAEAKRQKSQKKDPFDGGLFNM